MATKKPKKHPKDMTTDEAVAHLFHPKAVKHLKSEAAKSTVRVTKK